MNILFAHPGPQLGRSDFYFDVAEKLQSEFTHRVVFAYNGPKKAFNKSVSTWHFDSWVEENRKSIEEADLRDIQEAHPQSNLWLCIAAERLITDYSMLGGVGAQQSYALADLNFLIKALALFYQEIIKKYDIEVILAQHPDNVHSVFLFEFGKSLRIPAFMLWRDYYWDPETFLLCDDLHYRSSRLRKVYRKYMKNYEQCLEPREEAVENLIAFKLKNDPMSTGNHFARPFGMDKHLKNSWRWLLREKTFFGILPMPVTMGYWKKNVLCALESWFHRLKNLTVRSFSSYMAHEIPEGPYVYFPLHLQPEASLLAAAPVFQNQLAVIQAISASLPAGFVLVVKDHPKMAGYRSYSFYKRLKRFPNVLLVADSVSNPMLIEGAALVATIRGTAGFQAALQGKPVLLFARAWYDCIDAIVKVNNLNDLPVLLGDLLLHKQVNSYVYKRNVYAFVQAFEGVKRKRKRVHQIESAEEKAGSYAQLLNDLFEDEMEFRNPIEGEPVVEQSYVKSIEIV